MKKIFKIAILSLCILCFTTQSLIGQNNKKGEYKVWVTKLDTSAKTKGYISEVGDSTLTIMTKSKSASQILHVNVIDEIKFRKSNKIVKGILKGALIGAGIGVILGFLSGDDSSGFVRFDASYKAMIGATLLAPIGAVIGGIAGYQMSVKIPIRGNQSTYKGQQQRLKEYVF